MTTLTKEKNIYTNAVNPNSKLDITQNFCKNLRSTIPSSVLKPSYQKEWNPSNQIPKLSNKQ